MARGAAAVPPPVDTLFGGLHQGQFGHVDWGELHSGEVSTYTH